MDLLINPLFRDVLPALTNEEYNNLKDDIKTNGCKDEIIHWNNTIVDGHNRYAICKELGIEFKTSEKTFTSEDEAIDWIISNQNGKPKRNWANHIDERNKLIAGMYQKLQGKSNGKHKTMHMLYIAKAFNLSEVGIRKILRKRRVKNRNAVSKDTQKIDKLSIDEVQNTQRIAVDTQNLPVHTDLETNVPDTKMAIPVTPIETKVQVYTNEKCFAQTKEEATKKLQDEGYKVLTKEEFKYMLPGLIPSGITNEIMDKFFYANTEEEAKQKLQLKYTLIKK